MRLPFEISYSLSLHFLYYESCRVIIEPQLIIDSPHSILQKSLHYLVMFEHSVKYVLKESLAKVGNN